MSIRVIMTVLGRRLFRGIIHMLGVVEVALPPRLVHHLAGQLLPRMLRAEGGDPHAAVWCGDVRRRRHEATVCCKAKEQI